MEIIWSILAFIVAIGVLVTVHEFGHFWVARRLGVKVLRFSIGFGQPLWKRTAADGVEYVVAAIPLGGYVKMLDENEAEVDESELDQAFNRQGKMTRAAIAAAGPLLNFIFAIVAYWLVFTIGDTGTRPFIGAVEPASVAEQAGFVYGDQLKKVGDEDVASWEQALYVLLSAAVDAEDLAVTVQRETGAKVQLYLPGDDLGELVKDKKGVFEKLGLKPMTLPPVIGEIVAGEAAEKAGLKVGDRVVAANGEKIISWSQWVGVIQKSPDKTMSLKVERAGSLFELDVKVGSTSKSGQTIGRVGAAVHVPDDYIEKMRAEVRYDPITSVGLAVEKTGELSILTLKVIGKMLVGQASVHNLSGPITIAQTAGKTAEYGFIQFVKFLALVSVSLAVLNLLPVPVLDGGHLLFILIEAIRGKPLSDETLGQIQRIGLAILLSLMILAFYVDINRLINQ